MTDVATRDDLLSRPTRRTDAPLLLDSSSSPVKTRCGCFPLGRKKKSAKRAVRFSRQKDEKSGDLSTEPSLAGTPERQRSLSGKGLRVRPNKTPASLKRSTSRRSFYSCISTVRRQETSRTNPQFPKNAICTCGYPPHASFSAEMPIVTPPNVEPGSNAELIIHANAILGKWVTLLDRSQSLDAQMVHVGIGKMKRMVMNRLAIPFTAVLEENGTLLHCWISTPVGDKHTHSSLVGKETFDKDCDLGDWKATTSIVDYSCGWFCNGKTVRAMQMRRTNEKLGTAFETRTVLPDTAEGKVLLYNIRLYPYGENDPRGVLNVDRVYKVSC